MRTRSWLALGAAPLLLALSTSVLAGPLGDDDQRRKDERRARWKQLGYCPCQTTHVGVLCDDVLFAYLIDDDGDVRSVPHQDELLRLTVAHFPELHVRVWFPTVPDNSVPDRDRALLSSATKEHLSKLGFHKDRIILVPSGRTSFLNKGLRESLGTDKIAVSYPVVMNFELLGDVAVRGRSPEGRVLDDPLLRSIEKPVFCRQR